MQIKENSKSGKRREQMQKGFCWEILKESACFQDRGKNIDINIKEIGCSNVDWICLPKDTDLQRVYVIMIVNISISVYQ